MAGQQTPSMAANISEILDNYDTRRNIMAKTPCPNCEGTGKVPAASYTQPDVDCPECKGTGEVSEAKAEKVPEPATENDGA